MLFHQECSSVINLYYIYNLFQKVGDMTEEGWSQLIQRKFEIKEGGKGVGFLQKVEKEERIINSIF